ncbi:hypothetical protein PoB_001035500 [Plakobranchus ocellatus]|uniref:L-Fucosyltransferase n=1 Tax=Plakobranchus ocellatus TaxID=259542 RepID=A0AAV3YMA6_9GAST|nr:hypothetical protein PoB_001035500 [Plakobranchus ocellatus]
MTLCGGWADRVKGILLTYVIANLTGRIFKLEILEPPCNILQFVIPNLVNWTLSVTLHDRMDKNVREACVINEVDNVPFYNNIHFLNFTEMHPMRDAKYIYVMANLDYSEGLSKSVTYSHQLSWMSNLNNAEILSTLYKRIFKLSPYLQDKMNKFMTSTLPTQRHRLICAHARMGTNPTNPYDSVVRLHETDLAFVWKFLSQQSESDYDKIFFMSDSENAVRLANSQPFGHRIVDSGGPINHIDKSRYLNNTQRCDGMEKVIFDQHVLMQCDVLMISESGLSRMAAYVRGSDEGLYCLLKKGKIVPCKVGKIKSLFKVIG